ncbi:MAG: exodeoxyribonuclease III [Flavobacteriales bacterium]|nr:exodeoxyribonuclease III [Flavobacteriales bacterium]
MKRIISYNVNGIRAAIRKDFLKWLEASKADILCLQEIKATADQLEPEHLDALDYKKYWYPAEKKGYSGVSIWSKEEPKHVEYGMGMEIYDREGRVIRADYKDFSVISVYMPSGSSGDERQAFKMQWLDDFYSYVQDLKKEIPNLVISGDYNICHKPIDIHNPERNKDTSGFKPEEREWMSKFVDGGFIDSFRHFNEEPHQYSWWSYRANARAKNLGWRIDYNMVSEPMEDRLKRATILSEAKHSDHCPVLLEIED